MDSSRISTDYTPLLDRDSGSMPYYKRSYEAERRARRVSTVLLLILAVVAVAAVVAMCVVQFAVPRDTQAHVGAPQAAQARFVQLPTSDGRMQLVKMHNDYRKSKGLKPLRCRPSLMDVAQSWSRKMGSDNRMYHNPNWRTQYEKGWSTGGENVGYVAPDSLSRMMTGWKNSPPHNANILKAAYTHIGVGRHTQNGKTWYTVNLAAYPDTKDCSGGSTPPKPTCRISRRTARAGLWGTNGSGTLYRRFKGKWQRIGCRKFAQVTVGPSHLWGRSSAGVFSCKRPCGGKWVRRSKTRFVHIDASSGALFAVNTSGKLYWRHEAPRPTSKWNAVGTPKKPRVVSAGPKYLWMVAQDRTLYMKRRGKAWRRVSGKLDFLDVNSGRVCGTSGSAVYCRSVTGKGGWTRLPGALKQVTLGRGVIFGTNKSNNIYRCGFPCKKWTRLPGKLRWVDAAH